MSDPRTTGGSGTPGPAKSAQVHTPGKQDATDPSLGHAALPAPWRLEYIERLSQEEKVAGVAAGTKAVGAAQQGSGCFLRDYWLAPQLDVVNHIIVRSGEGMILLNAFPYANGHLLVALGEGRGRLVDYSPAARAALWRLTDVAADLMEETLEPQGINIGVNQGRAAGAGVPQHLHIHLVPRWAGDVNFMTAVGRVRVMPSSLEAMAERYRGTWARIGERWRGVLGA